MRSLRWADIPQLSAWDAPCPAAWLQCWLQPRRPGADPRPSFQAGYIPSRRGSRECYALSAVAACRWSLLLLSPLLSGRQWPESAPTSAPGVGYRWQAPGLGDTSSSHTGQYRVEPVAWIPLKVERQIQRRDQLVLKFPWSIADNLSGQAGRDCTSEVIAGQGADLPERLHPPRARQRLDRRPGPARTERDHPPPDAARRHPGVRQHQEHGGVGAAAAVRLGAGGADHPGQPRARTAHRLGRIGPPPGDHPEHPAGAPARPGARPVQGWPGGCGDGPGFHRPALGGSRCRADRQRQPRRAVHEDRPDRQ